MNKWGPQTCQQKLCVYTQRVAGLKGPCSARYARWDAGWKPCGTTDIKIHNNDQNKSISWIQNTSKFAENKQLQCLSTMPNRTKRKPAQRLIATVLKTLRHKKDEEKKKLLPATLQCNAHTVTNQSVYYKQHRYMRQRCQYNRLRGNRQRSRGRITSTQYQAATTGSGTSVTKTATTIPKKDSLRTRNRNGRLM